MMFHLLADCLNGLIPDGIIEAINFPNFKHTKSRKMNEKEPLLNKREEDRVFDHDSVPANPKALMEIIKGYNHENEEGTRKGVTRIQVKMTKEEAKRLLMKSKEGGVLDFKDVAQELSLIPCDRINVVAL